MLQTVDVNEVRVGMFVHLDLGWWAHPFALSSFLVTTPEQVTTIRGLGLKQLRWNPEKSLQADSPEPPGDGADAEAIKVSADGSGDEVSGASPHAGAGEGVAVDAQAAAHLAAAAAAEQAAAQQAAAQAASPLGAQRAAQRLCEQQYGEAGRAWHEAQWQVPRNPEKARIITESLTRSLLDKMMVDDIGVRHLILSPMDRSIDL